MTPFRSSAPATLVGIVLTSGLAACSIDASPASSANGACIPRGTTTETRDLPGLPTSGAVAGGITEVTSFGANPGALKMYVHAPKSGAASAVVLALHGCTQSASAYVGAGWNELADKAGLAIVYAEQTTANDAQRCFRWYSAAQTKRGVGEPASMAAMVEYAMKKYGASRAFVTGLSAGGAMTAVMLATYPELFEAGAVMSGLPYACASSQTEAYACMSPGKEKSPSDWAALLPAAARGAGAPRVAIWHGDADYIVRPSNADALVRQWTAASGVAATPSSTETVGAATHDVYKDASGVTQVERWLVKGMGHGVVLDPKNGCGTAGAYLLDKGLCSTQKTAVFFGLVTEEGTPTAPTGNGAAAGGGASSGAAGASSSSGASGDGCD
jgi:poly(hydroxyalkanoate) depolymerase family esterase